MMMIYKIYYINQYSLLNIFNIKYIKVKIYNYYKYNSITYICILYLYIHI